MRRVLTTSVTRASVGAAMLLAALTGCDTTAPSDHEPEIVVEAYLVAGESLPSVWVSRTEDVDREYDPRTAAVDEADVRVELLSVNGDVETSWTYVRGFGSAGRYVPAESGEVLAGRQYRLHVDVEGFDPVRSVAQVPGAFDLISVSHDAIEYQDPAQVGYTVTNSVYPGRQTIFIFSIAAENPSIETLTPLYRQIIYDIGPDESIEGRNLDPDEMNEILINTSPPVNEGNYDQNPDGTLTVSLPWFAVAFYGRTETVIYAVDDNLYDFLRYAQVQQGGSTLSPGEIPNVRDNVNGGRGVFAAMAKVSSVVDILRETD
ncbi:MAG: DUF4249 family protein [Rhodothermales bacterium]|nr:DUF4249 family protein [Rhodothermales bacterium]